MASHVGVQNAAEFLTIYYGTKSGRTGGATAACNIGVPDALLWQQDGGWKFDVKRRYVQHNKKKRQAVGRAILLLNDQPMPALVAPMLDSADPS